MFIWGFCFLSFFFFFTSSLPNLIRAPESSQKNFTTSKSLILPHTLWSVSPSCFPRYCAVLLIISFPLFSTFSPLFLSLSPLTLSLSLPLFFAVLTCRSASQGRRDSHSPLFFFPPSDFPVVKAQRGVVTRLGVQITKQSASSFEMYFGSGSQIAQNATTLCWDNKETLWVSLPLHSRVNARDQTNAQWSLKTSGSRAVQAMWRNTFAGWGISWMGKRHKIDFFKKKSVLFWCLLQKKRKIVFPSFCCLQVCVLSDKMKEKKKKPSHALKKKKQKNYCQRLLWIDLINLQIITSWAAGALILSAESQCFQKRQWSGKQKARQPNQAA